MIVPIGTENCQLEPRNGPNNWNRETDRQLEPRNGPSNWNRETDLAIGTEKRTYQLEPRNGLPIGTEKRTANWNRETDLPIGTEKRTYQLEPRNGPTNWNRETDCHWNEPWSRRALACREQAGFGVQLSDEATCAPHSLSRTTSHSSNTTLVYTFSRFIFIHPPPHSLLFSIFMHT